MSVRQCLAVAICVFLNVIDGFDILVMSAAAPALRSGLGLTTPQLGLVLSASLAGMTLGSLLIAPLADRFGRRSVILACLCVQLVGMVATGLAQDSYQVIGCRLAAGLGVGGMMPVLNTAVAELSSARRRNLAITAQAIGYPLGGLLAALAGAAMLESHGWRLLLQSAAVPTLLAIVLVAVMLPESVAYLLAKRPGNALARVNHALIKLGKAPLAQLPPDDPAARRLGARALLTKATLPALVLFAGATLLTQFSFYFFLSWLPTVLQPHLTGMSIKGAGSIMLNLGGIVGDVVFGLLCLKIGARNLALGAVLIAFVAVVVLGRTLDVPALTLGLPLVAGGALFAAMAGIYALAPQVFAPLVRAAGTGVAFSLGRFGGALSPLVGAWVLNTADLGVHNALLVMGLPLLAAAALFVFLTPARIAASLGAPS